MVVPAGIFVAPPREPAAGGPAGGVMARNAASKSALMAPEVTPASGYNGLMTEPPMRVGAKPPQRPNPPAASTATVLHCAVGFSTTLPYIVVFGAVPVLVTPAVAATPKGKALPRATGEALSDQAPVPPKTGSRLPLPHPVNVAASSNAMDHISGLVMPSYLSIFFSLLSSAKRHRYAAVSFQPRMIAYNNDT
jgi:hypothetical protein